MSMPIVRLVLISSALLSVFWFPYPATLVLSFIASIAFPFLGLLVGILVDALFYTFPHIPVGTFYGIAVSIAAFLVRRFIKARIMTA
jgi:hypothetical protein